MDFLQQIKRYTRSSYSSKYVNYHGVVILIHTKSEKMKHGLTWNIDGSFVYMEP